MHNKIILCISFIFLVMFVQAQEPTKENVELSQITDLGFLGINDVLQVNQIGNSNRITAIQQLSDNSSYILTAVQDGNSNTGYIKQDGNNHKSVLFQKGDANDASLWSIGSGTQNFVKQEGNGNQLQSYIENDNLASRIATSVQSGDNNKIDLQLIDINASNPITGVEVIQNGSNNFTELALDQFEAPYLKITQTGNSAPPVSVTHSAFSFPVK
jgi:hypothetical protein